MNFTESRPNKEYFNAFYKRQDLNRFLNFGIVFSKQRKMKKCEKSQTKPKPVSYTSGVGIAKFTS